MKKLFAVILAVVMIATMSVTAFAANTTGGSMEVTYSVAPAYTVTIPETITIGADGTSATVSAADVVVNKGQYVSVTLAADNNFTVKTTEGAELTYTVTANGETVAAGGEILAVNPADSATGTATITFDIDETAIQYAGTYTGSATFTISVEDAPVTIISFTIDEPQLGNKTFQADVGMTWGEWVASSYNTDGYTVVHYGEGDVIAGPKGSFIVLVGEFVFQSPEDVIVANQAYEVPNF